MKMNITQNASPNKSRGRAGWSPDIIVCHITDGAFDGSVAWITNPASQVSYHYVIAQDGRVVQAVDIADTAWANGTNNSTDARGNRHSRLKAVRTRQVNANLYSVSIGFEGRHRETVGRITNTQMEVALQLINHIRTEVLRIYSVTIPIDGEHIVGHRCITPLWRPNCPGVHFPFNEIISSLNTPPMAIPSSWAKEAWEWAVYHNITDGTNPQGIPTREQVVQLLYNAHHAK